MLKIKAQTQPPDFKKEAEKWRGRRYFNKLRKTTISRLIFFKTIATNPSNKHLSFESPLKFCDLVYIFRNTHLQLILYSRAQNNRINYFSRIISHIYVTETRLRFTFFSIRLGHEPVNPNLLNPTWITVSNRVIRMRQLHSIFFLTPALWRTLHLICTQWLEPTGEYCQ